MAKKEVEAASSKAASNNYDRVLLRVDPALKSKMTKCAKENDESVNSFIVRAISDAVDRDNQSTLDAISSTGAADLAVLLQDHKLTFKGVSLSDADQKKLIADLLETRLLVEPSVAALAAVRREESHLAEMKSLLDKMDNAYLHGEDYTPFDFEFHSVIAQCTGNDVLQRLLPTIHESIQAGYQHTKRVEGSYQRASQCHLEMYRAIAEHDSERARQAAQRHMMQTMHDSCVEVPGVLIK